MSQNYLIRGRITKNIDLILILFYIYTAQSCGKIKYVKNTFLSNYLKSFLTGNMVHVRHPELNELASSCKRWNESHVDQVTRLIEIHRGRFEAKPSSIDQSGKESEGNEEEGIIV